MIQAFSLSMVNSTNALANLSTFFQAKRREATLTHFPGHIGEHHKAQLQASAYGGSQLFEEDVLTRVLSESREDSAVSANVALIKGFTFPIFGKKAQEQKASSPVVPRGQGGQRGKGKGGFSGYKCKAQSQSQSQSNQSNSKSPKSARGAPSSGNSGSNRGRGFQK